MTALLCALVVAAGPGPAAGATPVVLRVGVTLHPYYSWVANVARQVPGVEVVAVLPGDVDVGSYQPRPQDVAALKGLDALVVNGLGHDDFITAMLKASGNTACRVLRPSDVTPVLKSAHAEAVNSHTFLSFSNAIQQTYVIARALGELRPALNAKFQENATLYAKRLRGQRSAAMARLLRAKQTKVVTVHDGYAYLLQEFGIELAGVVEPSHGLLPSAQELGDVVKLVQREHVTVVLAEEAFPQALRDTLTAAGAEVTQITHISQGPYTADRFERDMQLNVDALAKALGAP